MAEGDVNKMENVIIECIAAGLPELDNFIQWAREKLDEMKSTPEKGLQNQ